MLQIFRERPSAGSSSGSAMLPFPYRLLAGNGGTDSYHDLYNYILPKKILASFSCSFVYSLSPKSDAQMLHSMFFSTPY